MYERQAPGIYIDLPILEARGTYAEVMGFCIAFPNCCQPVQDLMKRSLNSNSQSIMLPLEESLRIEIKRQGERTIASIAGEDLVEGNVTTAGGTPLKWDNARKAYVAADGARYRGKLCGLKFAFDLKEAEAAALASALNEYTPTYASMIPLRITTMLQEILESFVEENSRT